MRKIFLFIFSILPVFMSIQCSTTPIKPNPPVIENPNPITNFIDDLIPNQLYETLVLPEEDNGYNLKWYLDNVEIEDNLLIRPFQFENSRHVIKMQVSNSKETKSFEKFIDFMAYEFVSTLFITTEGPIVDRDNYVNGVTTVKNGNDTLLIASMKMKGRGNSTWDIYPKKPYRMKFDERQSLLGMKSARDYVLLSEHGDKSLLRNYLAMKIAETSKLDYILESRYVEIYLNNQYQGVYLLTEQVEIDENRLSIDNSVRSDGGFMVELETWDRYEKFGIENVDWVQVYNRAYMIKHPDPDDFTIPQMNQKASYIKNYLQATYDSMGNNTYMNFLDVDVFMDYFIIQELTKNVDVSYSSVFMYKDLNEKLKMGPLWDFDISMGNGDYYPSGPQGFWAVQHPYLDKLLKNSIFKYNYKLRFIEFLNNEDVWLATLDEAIGKLTVAAYNNFERWPIMYEYVWPNSDPMMQRHTHLEQYQYLRAWLSDRITWLKSNVPNL